MTKRPIPKPKEDEALDNFINESSNEKTVKQKIITEEEIVKKSLKIRKTIDDALRIESATTREKQQDIMEKAIKDYLANKGYKNI